MSNNEPEEESYGDSVAGITAYEAPEPQRKSFLPWHRPRKQFVRCGQWEEQIKKLLEDMKPINGTLRYFGLPGDDLLDIRYFHDAICEPQNLKLRYLGFNTSLRAEEDQQADTNVSIDEVNKLTCIDPESEVIPDDFCRIASKDSIAWKKMFEHGPYDVVNLDLCDGFGAHAPDPVEETYYNALSNLLVLQSKTKVPWLLFITTRTGNKHIHSDVLGKLVKRYQDNLECCNDFKIASIDSFSIGDVAALEKALTTEKGLSDVFVAGLCKWLIGLAVKFNPPMKVEMRSVIGYRIEKDATNSDLVSFALRFTPILTPVADATGLSGGVATLDECDFSPKILNKIANCVDADKLLAEKPDILQRMIKDTTRLLDIARYDISTYAAFIDADA